MLKLFISSDNWMSSISKSNGKLKTLLASRKICLVNTSVKRNLLSQSIKNAYTKHSKFHYLIINIIILNGSCKQ